MSKQEAPEYKGRLREITAVLRKHGITRGVTPEKLRLILDCLLYTSIEAPFNKFKEGSFAMDMSIAESLGWKSTKLNDWFWRLLDEYIMRALKEEA